MRGDEKIVSIMEENDIIEPFREVVDVVGFEVAKKLMLELGGMVISVPKPKSIRNAVERLILSYSHKYSARQIARHLDMNERVVRRILSKLCK